MAAYQYLSKVICVVDGSASGDELTETASLQIAASDALLLNKCDVGNEGD